MPHVKADAVIVNCSSKLSESSRYITVGFGFRGYILPACSVSFRILLELKIVNVELIGYIYSKRKTWPREQADVYGKNLRRIPSSVPSPSSNCH